MSLLMVPDENFHPAVIYCQGSVPVETKSRHWIWPRSIFIIGKESGDETDTVHI